ncbi:uncharacterized protein LOC134686476 [Mytilus trossulus]|uniref:uncharacterized protein LOC134686476 n=1 Tax=Mytilus trossulus TaxID=6551 RepID=UPI003007B83F
MNVDFFYLSLDNKEDNTINSNNEEVIKEMYYVNLDEVIDNNSLVGALKEFYQDFKYPVYKEKKIPQDAEILNITRSAGGRVKRFSAYYNSDCNGLFPRRVFGRDTGTSSNYLKICQRNERINGQWRLTDCGNIHILSPLIYHCICCPWVTMINPASDECTCTRMNEW